jgi:hypothetical protein
MPLDQDENLLEWSDDDDNDNVQTWQWARSVDAADPAESFVDADDEPEEVLIDTDDLLDLDADPQSDVLNWPKQPLMSKDSLMSLGRKLSPILIPLPFALIVFGLTLPFTSRSDAGTALTPLWTGALLLALAIVQGVLLTFVGENDTLWMVYIAFGYALFIIAGIFAVTGPVGAVLMLIGFVALGIYLGWRFKRITNEGYVDLVAFFGKYTHTLYPGINLVLPWEKVSHHLNTQESVWTSPFQRVPTSRDQDVQLAVSISYQLVPQDAYLAVTAVKEWESALQKLLMSEVQSVVNDLTPNDFLTWTQSIYTPSIGLPDAFDPAAATRWDRINDALRKRVEAKVATWGVQVNWVGIQDVTILPHVEGATLPSFQDDTTQVTFVQPSKQTFREAAPIADDGKKPESPKESAGSVASAGKAVKVDQLVEFYESVRQNIITSPKLILDLAQRFEELAKDPVHSKTIDFDANLAAMTLRKRAQKLQDKKG